MRERNVHCIFRFATFFELRFNDDVASVIVIV